MTEDRGQLTDNGCYCLNHKSEIRNSNDRNGICSVIAKTLPDRWKILEKTCICVSGVVDLCLRSWRVLFVFDLNRVSPPSRNATARQASPKNQRENILKGEK